MTILPRLDVMDFEVPHTFSPSSLSQFTSCPLAFRYNYVEHRPSPPQIAATKGTIIHRALERLFLHKPNIRTCDIAHDDLDISFDEFSSHPDLVDLHLSDVQYKELVNDSHQLIDNYFQIEDPRAIVPVGLELKLHASFGDTLIRGIIDRLEVIDGELIITDYKTGTIPRENNESSKMTGIQVYASLCYEIFGVLPSRIQLLYLSSPALIVTKPTMSSLHGIKQRAQAVHKAVIRACETRDFRPRPSALCNWCGYRDLCPTQGGVLPND